MATLSPRSPLFSHAPYSPLEYLPVTRFGTAVDSYNGRIHEAEVEKKKEQEVILSQPYRTTPLITPGAKARPDLVNNKLSGKPMRPTVHRPLDEKSVVAKLDEDRALVNRQFNSPKSLYSNQNVAEAIYLQTGVQGVHMKPEPPKQFNPDASPTFQVLMAQETHGQPARLIPAPHIQQAPPQKITPHATAPTNYINSIGQPSQRIAQSESFRRLMLNVMGE